METGGRRGGGRESWVKTGDIVACRAAVCGNGKIHGEAEMATRKEIRLGESRYAAIGGHLFSNHNKVYLTLSISSGDSCCGVDI